MSVKSLLSNHAYLLVLTYTIFVIFQMYYVKTYIQNWQANLKSDNVDFMQHNIENKKDLNKAFSNEIEQRLKMLANDETSYAEWVNYNNKNYNIKFGKHSYDISVYERIRNSNANYGSKDKFILRANKIKEKLGLTYDELLRQDNYSFLFSIFSPHPDFLHTMFDSPMYSSGVNIFSHFSVDKELNRPVKSIAIGGPFQKKSKDGSIFEGVIYASYPVLDVEDQYANKYYDFMNRKFIGMISLGTLAIALMLYFASPSKNTIWLPYLFLLATNWYLLSFMDITEGITNEKGEDDRTKDINEGILAISFLAGVNVFVVQSLRDGKDSASYYEAAILFMLGLILLLFSLYKITNYNRIDEIRTHRIQKQFLYNGSIYINFFILIYYSFFVVRKSKVFPQLLSSMKKTFIKS